MLSTFIDYTLSLLQSSLLKQNTRAFASIPTRFNTEVGGCLLSRRYEQLVFDMMPPIGFWMSDSMIKTLKKLIVFLVQSTTSF